MKWSILKNRTVVGLGCILLSLIICFGLTPLWGSAARGQTDIIRIAGVVKKGEMITSGKVETVRVGAYNLPGNVVKRKDEAVGKYAAADLEKGDYILSTKLSDTPLTEFEYLNELDGTKQAMSITIKSFAAGLSGKLEPGDIISLISAGAGSTGLIVTPPELKYVKVLAVTLGTGADKEYKKSEKKNAAEEKELPATLTLLVNTSQAKVLAGLEQNGNLHTALVYRGEKTNADKFLMAQEQYFKPEAGTNEQNPEINLHIEGAKNQAQEGKKNAE